MNTTQTLPSTALLNEYALWMTPTPEIHALHYRKMMLQQGTSKRRGYLSVSDADPDGPDAGKCSVAFWQSWVEGGNVWADTGSTIPTGQIRSCHQYLSSEALELIEGNPNGLKITALTLVIPSESS